MAYCSIEDLKGFGYSITDENEADMERICEIASAKVEAYCHQSFTRTEGAKFLPREAVDYFKQQKCVKTAFVNQRRFFVLFSLNTCGCEGEYNTIYGMPKKVFENAKKS